MFNQKPIVVAKRVFMCVFGAFSQLFRTHFFIAGPESVRVLHIKYLKYFLCTRRRLLVAPPKEFLKTSEVRHGNILSVFRAQVSRCRKTSSVEEDRWKSLSRRRRNQRLRKKYAKQSRIEKREPARYVNATIRG